MGKWIRYENVLKMVDQSSPKNILDIGVWNGVRSSEIIQRAKLHNLDSSIYYYGFDLWDRLTPEKKKQEISKPQQSYDKVYKRLIDLLPPSHIQLIQGDTVKTLKKAVLPIMDFIFIDGGHSLETVTSDWENCQRLIGLETITLFDDYWIDKDDGPRVLIDSIDRSLFSVDMLDPIESIDNFSRICMVKVVLK